MKKISLLLLLTLLHTLAVQGQKDKKLTEQTVTKNVVESHIYFLASDELKGRNAPSPELDIAAQYLATQLQRNGIKIAPGMDSYFQPVNLLHIKSATSGSLKIKDRSLKFVDDFVMLDGSNIDVEKPFVFVNHGTAEDLEDADIDGKIVIAICGDGQEASPQTFFMQGFEKKAMVKEKGGIALLELFRSQALPFSVLKNFFNQDQVALDEGDGSEGPIPHLWLNFSDEGLKNMVESNEGDVSLQISGMERNNTKSYNIVGYVEGRDSKLKDEFVVYSAHYDHVGVGNPDENGDSIYNGARDNAVGVSTVLLAGENIARNPTKRSALFVFFTAEEKGLLGSRYFVQNSPIPLNKMIYCFNSDNAGYNSTSVVTMIGLTRTTAEPIIQKACNAYGLTAIDDPAPEQGLFDRSDNVNFAIAGVPSPTIGLGFTSFDGDVTKYYHQPSDEPESLDYDYLLKFFRSYVYGARMIGNAKEVPFWVEGDKYFEAGMKLYNKQ